MTRPYDQEISISGIKALNKTYDGTTSAEIDISALVKKGLIPGDELEILTSANFWISLHH